MYGTTWKIQRNAERLEAVKTNGETKLLAVCPDDVIEWVGQALVRYAESQPGRAAQMLEIEGQ